MSSTADKLTILRRDCRDIIQEAEHLEELAVGKLTSEDASKRFSAEAAEKRVLLAAKEQQIVTLTSSQQTRLF